MNEHRNIPVGEKSSLPRISAPKEADQWTANATALTVIEPFQRGVEQAGRAVGASSPLDEEYLRGFNDALLIAVHLLKRLNGLGTPASPRQARRIVGPITAMIDAIFLIENDHANP